jgi:hypothetical protein
LDPDQRRARQNLQFRIINLFRPRIKGPSSGRRLQCSTTFRRFAGLSLQSGGPAPRTSR